MSRTIPRVYTHPDDIERLKGLQQALDGELEVALTMCDGRTLHGTVPERPTVQQFFDEAGNEGTNGMFKFDAADGSCCLLLLGDVVAVLRTGSA